MNHTQKIYLDNNATTAVDERVLDALISYLRNIPGNPSSSHYFGREAKSFLQKARDDLAKYLRVLSREILFTSGATEALNLIIRGVLDNTIGHVISSDVEHSAVFSTLKDLERKGLDVTYLKTGVFGAVTLEAVKEALRADTKAIVLMAVNNETGVKTDIEVIGAFAKEKGVPLIVDGVALFGKEPFRINSGISAMAFSGHKFHAPKGIGFAFIRENVKVAPWLTGGDQEYGRRGGTENLPGVAALQKAVELLDLELDEASLQMRSLRDHFESVLLDALPNVSINGQGERVVNTSNLCFRGIEGEVLLANLDQEGIAVSLGSACASGALEPSRILLNMGLSREDAASSIRFSLSRFSTLEEMDRAAAAVIKIVKRLGS